MQATWNDYFPFSKGQKLAVDGPLNYDGYATVNNVTDTDLDLTIRIPATTVLFTRYPAIDAHIVLSINRDGGGNYGSVTFSDNTTVDKDVHVRSDKQTGTREIAFAQRIAGQLFTMKLRRLGQNASITVPDGHKFTLYPKTA